MIHPKHNSRTILIAACVPFVMGACRKDQALPPDINCVCCEEFNSPDFLAAGDITGLRVQERSDTLTFAYTTDTVWIDPENDGEYDFQILSYSTTSMGGAIYQSGAQINCLNDQSYVNVQLNADTTYMYQNPTTYSGSNPVMKEEYYYVGCVANTCCDSVTNVSNKLNYFTASASIEAGQSWVSGGNHLMSSSAFTIPTGPGPVVNDTATYAYTTYDHTCINIPQGVSYIGIKRTNCSSEKLGWIKFNFENSHIVLTQVAIQP